MERREGFAASTDDHYPKAVDYVASELSRDDIRALRRDALATRFPDDGLIVSRMVERERQVQQLGTSLSELKKLLRQRHQKLQELEALRTDFRRRRYDQPGYGAADGTLIAAMLGSFFNGMLDRHGLSRVLQQQQRYRPRRTDPTFGSGGFGRGTIWGGRAERRLWWRRRFSYWGWVLSCSDNMSQPDTRVRGALWKGEG